MWWVCKRDVCGSVPGHVWVCTWSCVGVYLAMCGCVPGHMFESENFINRVSLYPSMLLKGCFNKGSDLIGKGALTKGNNIHIGCFNSYSYIIIQVFIFSNHFPKKYLKHFQNDLLQRMFCMGLEN